MKPADTSQIDELLRTYNYVHPMHYAFYDNVTGHFSDHEEALLLEDLVDGLPSSPPEVVSLREFYGPLYFFEKDMLVFVGSKSTKRPVPYYYETTGKPYGPEDVIAYTAQLEKFDLDFRRLSNAFTTYYEGERWGYCLMMFHEVDRDLEGVSIRETFREVEAFMTDDIKNCIIYDWRADLGPHCTEEDSCGCFGCYLWTVFCPKKNRLSVIRWHYNYVYA